MEIRQFVWDVVDSNSWLITEGNNGLLIDAIDSKELYQEIMRLDSLTIILTHSHFDHIYGLNQIREIRSDAKVIATRLCSDYLGNIYKNMSSSATAFMVFYSGSNDIEVDPITCSPADVVFDDEHEFMWCDHRIRLAAFHGHSADSLIAFIDDRMMFSGDTILPIPTITRFPSGSTKIFWEEDMPRLRAIRAIKAISTMDGGMTVYPGHGDAGRLDEMIAVNKMPERYRGK